MLSMTYCNKKPLWSLEALSCSTDKNRRAFLKTMYQEDDSPLYTGGGIAQLIWPVHLHSGGKEMEYANPTPTAGRPRVCIDRLLPRDILRHQEITEEAARSGTPQSSRAVIIPKRVWPNGSKLRVQFLGGTAAHHASKRFGGLMLRT
jgi:hypothetical protein